MTQEKYYTINEAASKLGITPKTLKSWEKDGLIPAAKRNYLFWRVYTEEDITAIREARGLDRIHDPGKPTSNGGKNGSRKTKPN